MFQACDIIVYLLGSGIRGSRILCTPLDKPRLVRLPIVGKSCAQPHAVPVVSLRTQKKVVDTLRVCLPHSFTSCLSLTPSSSSRPPQSGLIRFTPDSAQTGFVSGFRVQKIRFIRGPGAWRILPDRIQIKPVYLVAPRTSNGKKICFPRS